MKVEVAAAIGIATKTKVWIKCLYTPGIAARRLLSPLPLVLRSNLFLSQFVVPLGKAKILQEFPVHPVLTRVTMRLGFFNAVPVVLPVLIVMRIILRLCHFLTFIQNMYIL